MFTLKIIPDGAEPFEIRTGSRDIVKWESTGRGRSIGQLAENLRFTDLTDLAFITADRLGLFAGDIREWRESVDIEVLDSDEVGPTRADRSPAT